MENEHLVRLATLIVCRMGTSMLVLCFLIFCLVFAFVAVFTFSGEPDMCDAIRELLLRLPDCMPHK